MRRVMHDIWAVIKPVGEVLIAAATGPLRQPPAGRRHCLASARPKGEPVAALIVLDPIHTCAADASRRWLLRKLSWNLTVGPGSLYPHHR